MKKKAGAIFGAVLVFCAAAGGYMLYSNQQEKMHSLLDGDAIYNSISVNGIDVSNLEKHEAEELLESKLNKPFEEMKISVVKDDKTWEFLYTDFAAGYDVETGADAAYIYGREGSLKERYKIVKALEEENVDITCAFEFDESKVAAVVEGLEKVVNADAVDSTLSINKGNITITDDEIGFVMDKKATAENIIAAIESMEDATIYVEGKDIQPKVTRETNEMSIDLIGSYYTTYTSGNPGRNENLRVGSNYINGTIVNPGEVFSMNIGLGEQTYEGGYKDAAVIVNGKIEDGLAGGVCQVTSTLYNAVILAELEVVERSNHSLTVGYVPLGQDAAIAGDYKDFKFRNDTEYPVYIEAYTTGSKVVCNVYGHEIHNDGRKVVFENVMKEKIEKPEEKVTEDPTLPFGTREVTSTGYIGYKYETYKNVYEGGELVSRALFSRSSYKATPDEVTVGTGPAGYVPPAETETTEEPAEVTEEPSDEVVNTTEDEADGSIFG